MLGSLPRGGARLRQVGQHGAARRLVDEHDEGEEHQPAQAEQRAPGRLVAGLARPRNGVVDRLGPDGGPTTKDESTDESTMVTATYCRPKK